MSVYHVQSRHLVVSPIVGVRMKSLPSSRFITRRWLKGEVTMGGHTFPVLFSEDHADYLLAMPTKNPRWAEFESFFGFRAGDYNPECVRGVSRDSFQVCKSENERHA